MHVQRHRFGQAHINYTMQPLLSLKLKAATTNATATSAATTTIEAATTNRMAANRNRRWRQVKPCKCNEMVFNLCNFSKTKPKPKRRRRRRRRRKLKIAKQERAIGQKQRRRHANNMVLMFQQGQRN